MTKHSVCRTPYLRNHTSYDCDFWNTCVQWWILQQIFSFLKSWFLGFIGGKRAENDLKLPISVCFALNLRNCRSYHQDFYNDIYRCFSLHFFKKCKIVNIKTILFLLAHFNSFCLIIICFSSSWINDKKKFWGVPHLLHMCIIFWNSIWL